MGSSSKTAESLEFYPGAGSTERKIFFSSVQPEPNILHELQCILDSTEHAICILNNDFTVRRVNLAFARLLGTEAAALEGKKCYEIHLWPLCNTPQCCLRRILGGEKLVACETSFLKPDGSRIPCFAKALPLSDADGNIVGAIETFRDATEIRRFQQELRESEERYRTLIELGTRIGEAVIMLQDIDGSRGIQTYVSDRYLQIIGYSREELIGRCAFDLISPKFRQQVQERYQKKISGAPTPDLIEHALVHKDGHEVPVESTSAATIYNGRPSVVVYIRDITERRASEKQLRESEANYRHFFQNAPVALWESDFSGCKKYFDELRAKGIADFKKYFYTHPNEVTKCRNLMRSTRLNQAALDLYEASNVQALYDHILRALPNSRELFQGYADLFTALAEGKTDFIKEETKISTKGNRREVVLRYSIAPDCEQTLSKVFISAFDITKRVQAEEQLKAYQEHLEDMIQKRTSNLKQEIERRRQAEKWLKKVYAVEKKLRQDLDVQAAQKTEFTRAIVHELKTPLTPLVGAIELLAVNLREEPWSTFSKQAHESALDLDVRIDELFDYTRGEIGSLQLDYSQIDPVDFLRQIATYVSPQSSETGHHLVLKVPKTLPGFSCDIRRLRQILLNLLDNAFKYTPSGTTVFLKAWRRDSHMVFQVKDTGPGIPRDRLRHIFLPYTRTTKDREHLSGMGLGLTLCKTLVELHGGRIWARSKSGMGSSFSFAIPMNESPKSQ